MRKIDLCSEEGGICLLFEGPIVVKLKSLHPAYTMRKHEVDFGMQYFIYTFLSWRMRFAEPHLGFGNTV